MEAVINDEIANIVSDLQNSVNQARPIDPTEIFAASIVNLLWMIVGGTSYKRGDAQFVRLLSSVKATFRLGRANINECDKFPLNLMAPQYFKRVDSAKEANDLYNFIEESVRKNKESLDANNIRDFIDMYLLEMKKYNGNTDFSEERLISTCFDFFTLGAEALVNSLSFLILYLTLNPSAQKQSWAELDEIVGKSQPTSEIRKKLPIVEATLSEALRISSVAAVGAPHAASKDANIGKYKIPKDTLIFYSIWAVHHDREYWGDSHKFRVNRFIDGKGKYWNHANFIPFGLGERQCPAKDLASTILFMYFTTLLQKFEFSVPTGTPEPSTDPEPGFLMAPKQYKATVRMRD